ncbi:MAG: tRNA 5-methoxyuridine(34)/uridine 5-oxyacetic acid(34) synthase CmoB [Gammaproteobacteria bacterium]|nr:tRNA 5-methoxyuridine(34)/uridine 5-oxyacetic acid(34) synthase CmoB [Gammaproteobacteria bacterium]MCY4198965.1 tRNA 5-methoxyuridine(34)/uridine 5-oxyacetic acid(34) synthase CmoB [Gammaproteobacteria bacterium]MCY4277681.1 tRNA 5-methoxyuridine(34)/uridine 5-oxyacetic acid(34) synthase CmoB [Gammaproteobacteria bacterium]MCY4323317.1 tRNA 5-methoxyuridine(34)/uridine 5-oxyacetic acid(34) synthase CmoB [Gammaproteobacteria bacterium]
MLEPLLKWQLNALPAALRSSQVAGAALDRIATHGDAPRWSSALQALPTASVGGADFGDCVTVDLDDGATVNARLRDALTRLTPWRKGPFRLGAVEIDAEWRSNVKWSRLSPIHAKFKDARILDVGCGNGYYGWRMLECGAESVFGIDHNPLCTAQHLAMQRYLRDEGNLVLPVSLDELPSAWTGFDIVCSLGVLSHSRAPPQHLAELAKAVRRGGLLLLESLVLGGASGELRPAMRYARMRNVWRLPGVARLRILIEAAGFTQVELLDVSRTHASEQRRTDWMPFGSLADSLNLSDSSRTVEGYPAPHRAIFTAKRS